MGITELYIYDRLKIIAKTEQMYNKNNSSLVAKKLHKYDIKQAKGSTINLNTLNEGDCKSVFGYFSSQHMVFSVAIVSKKFSNIENNEMSKDLTLHLNDFVKWRRNVSERDKKRVTKFGTKFYRMLSIIDNILHVDTNRERRESLLNAIEALRPSVLNLIVQISPGLIHKTIRSLGTFARKIFEAGKDENDNLEKICFWRICWKRYMDDMKICFLLLLEVSNRSLI